MIDLKISCFFKFKIMNITVAKLYLIPPGNHNKYSFVWYDQTIQTNLDIPKEQYW
jgi:hypothetical protein